jgi:hypothetical protein
MVQLSQEDEGWGRYHMDRAEAQKKLVVGLNVYRICSVEQSIDGDREWGNRVLLLLRSMGKWKEMTFAPPWYLVMVLPGTANSRAV